MRYDFDEIIPRRGTDCVKYDNPQVGDRMPLWVADMDFATPPFIMDALRRRMDHPVLGYPVVPSDYYPMIARWVKGIHGWDVRSGHIRYIPGIVKGIGIALNCFLGPGDKVVIQPPVYHPFRLVPKKNGFEVLFNPLLPQETDDPQPLLDAVCTSLTLLAQWLSAQKKWECWIVWLVVNVMNLVLYLRAGLDFMPFVAGLYLINGVWSLISWKKSE